MRSNFGSELRRVLHAGHEPTALTPVKLNEKESTRETTMPAEFDLGRGGLLGTNDLQRTYLDGISNNG